METYQLHVERVEELTNQVFRVLVQSEQPITYLPGQYIELETDKGFVPISIANKPSSSHRLEFHIRRQKGAVLNDALFSTFDSGEITCHGAKGHCHLEKLSDDKPLVLIVAGTGFAPAKALLEALLSSGKSTHLYWLSNDRDGFYLQDIIYAWGESYANFHYHLMAWSRTESIASLMAKWQPTLSRLLESEVFMAGPFDMMFKLRDMLVTFGFNQNQLLSDAFSLTAGE